jgi:NurA-like 5'-3' nuclease
MNPLKSLFLRNSTSVRENVVAENSRLDIPLPARLVLYDGSERDYFILRTEEDFQRAALEILSERAAEGSFYPTREELASDRQKAFEKLVEIYGTVTPEETKNMSPKDSVKALSDYFNRKTVATELQKAFNEDLQFVEDLEAILSYNSEEIFNNADIRNYVYQMAAFLFFERKDYPREDFDFEELGFNLHIV